MKKRMRLRLAIVVGIVGVVALPFSAAADIYQYVDAEGVIHFTSVKPSGGAKPLSRPHH